MHHCYRAIVLIGQVRIPEDLLCVCGHKSPLAITAATLERYQTVHPVCSACRGKGRVERTRCEKKGKKRKHDD